MAVEAEEMYLYIPEKEAAYAEEIADQAAARGIQVKTGIVNCRESRGGAFHHIETLIAIADIFEGNYEPCTYMAVCKDGVTGPLVKVAYGTKISELTGEVDARAIAVGTRLYDLSALEMAVSEDTQIGNGVITVYGSKCCMIHEGGGCPGDRAQAELRQMHLLPGGADPAPHHGEGDHTGTGKERVYRYDDRDRGGHGLFHILYAGRDCFGFCPGHSEIFCFGV